MDRRPSIAKNTAFVVLRQVFMAALGIFFVGYVARDLGASDWGELQASLAAASMATVAAGIGVRGYVAREIAVHPERGPALLGAALAIRGAAGAAILGLVAAGALALGSGTGATLLALAAASELATLLYGTYWLAFEAHERFQDVLCAELVARVGVVVLGITLLWMGFGVVAVASTLLLGNVVELGVTRWLIRRHLYPPRLEASLPELWRIAVKSLPLGLCGAAAAASQQLDRVMLRLLADEAAVGVYSAAWVLTDNLLRVSDLLMTACFAAGMRLFVRDRDGFGRLFGRSARSLLLLGAPAGAGVFLLAEDAIALVYGPGYGASADVLRVLALRVPLAFALQAFLLPLLAGRREGAVFKLRLAALAASAGLSLVLVPRWGAAGAALGSLLVTAGALFASARMSAEWLRFLEPRALFGLALSVAGMGLAVLAARPSLGTFGAMGAGALVYAALVVATGAVSPGELRSLVGHAGRAKTEAAAPPAPPSRRDAEA